MVVTKYVTLNFDRSQGTKEHKSVCDPCSSQPLVASINGNDQKTDGDIQMKNWVQGQGFSW